jgi:S-adenosylmethionine/arginine decarboxylase-like enzyme
MLEHQHLIVRAEINKAPTCPMFIKQWLTDVIESIDMKLAVGLEANPISYYCNLEGNEGLTGAAILETSHCVVHVWDGDKPAIMQFDLYTCSALPLDVIFKKIEQFDPIKIEYTFYDRENNLTLLRSGVISTPKKTTFLARIFIPILRLLGFKKMD